MSKLPIVEVLPNPYAGLDADGVPQAVVGLPGTRMHIGAFRDLGLSEKTGKSRFYFPGFPNRTFKVPLDQDIANAMLDGSLLAADQESARKAGIVQEYKPLKEVLEAEKAKALASLRAQRGASATLGEVPTEPAPVNTPETSPTEIPLGGKPFTTGREPGEAVVHLSRAEKGK